MSLVGLPRCVQRLLCPAVEPNGHGRECRFHPAGVDFSIAFQVQANLDGAGMKTLAPIERRVRLEVVPFKAHAGTEDAAVERHPARAELPPGRALGKYRRLGSLFLSYGHDINSMSQAGPQAISCCPQGKRRPLGRLKKYFKHLSEAFFLAKRPVNTVKENFAAGRLKSQGDLMKTLIANRIASTALALCILFWLCLLSSIALAQTPNWNYLTNWVQTSAPGNYWDSITSSTNGSDLVATAEGEGIWTSANTGSTWAENTNAQGQYLWSVASSVSGNNLVAAALGGGIWTSANAGSTWTLQTGAPSESWYSVASSASGSNLVAVVYGGGIWTSTNAGTAWTQQTNAPNESWHAVASSVSGVNLVAVGGGGIYISTNSGTIWTQQTNEQCNAVASSASGSNLVAAISSSGIWASTNAGVTWARDTNAPGENWESLASSADGTKLAAVAYNQGIWVSTNSGATWIQTDAPGSSWFSVTCSSDGTKMAAVALNGGIWTAQAFPPSAAPPLRISISGNTIKVYWQNVSGWAVYQSSSILPSASWSPSGGINTTNGTNYLTITLPAGNTFFKLEQ